MVAFRTSGYMDTKSELVVVQGASFGHFWALQADDGSFYDTTGHDAQMQVRLTPDADTALATYTVDNGRLVVGQTVGTYTGCLMLSLAPEDTEALPGGLVAGYDVILITPSGRRVPLASQSFCVADAYTEVS